MAAPSVRSVGTPAFGTGAVTPGLPAGVQPDDLLLLAVSAANEFANVATGNPEWGYYDGGARGSPGAASAVRIDIWWARASAVAAAPLVPDAGDYTFAVIAAIKDCLASGDPVGALHTNMNGASSGTITFGGGVTTTVDDCLAVLFAGVDVDADGTAQFGTLTNAALTGLTEHFDQTTSTATGGGIGIFSGVKATAGALGSTTVAQSPSSVWASVTVAVRPASGVDASMRRKRGRG